MTAGAPDPTARWSDAIIAASLFAVDPAGLAGIALRALPGPVRDAFLAKLRGLLPDETPWRRMPAAIDDDRLLGGLDLVATLNAGRPVVGRGLLAEADGGIVLVTTAERLSAGTAARIGSVLDTGQARIERDGIALVLPTRIGIVAIDEGMEDDEIVPASLRDRMAFAVDLGGISIREMSDIPITGEAVLEARERLSRVIIGDAAIEALCLTAVKLGIVSLRVPLLAIRAARAAAALSGREIVDDEDLRDAARLVLAPRALILPDQQEQEGEGEDAESPPPPPDDASDEPPEDAEEQEIDGDLSEIILEAVKASLPQHLLEQLTGAISGGAPSRARGKATGAAKVGALGRPVGVRRGEPGRGARLNLIATLRASAPWQPLRRRVAGETARGSDTRIHVRRDDFRVTVRKPRSLTTTIFAVDASGSSALNRLAEAKGAVELLLAECYVRRDRVALIAFRGKAAELILPPTRSLVRAKRSLAGLAGGGATPLASGIDAAALLADAVRRKGESPALVILTDGRANIGRDGQPGREAANADAMTAARMAGASRYRALLVDISPFGQPLAQALAEAMVARYLALPQASADKLSSAVLAALPRA
jgi:magnesium chelatase subunit D